jgi:hypothetical protein
MRLELPHRITLAIVKKSAKCRHKRNEHMFPPRVTSAILILAVATLSTGCMTNDRYGYSNKKRYKRTSIGRQAPKPEPEQSMPLMTTPSVPAAPPSAAPAPAPATEAPPADSSALPAQ